ncbi:MFS transporter [Paenibacillus alkalitolerans]|uniref:MFS transporter n=1 Tax=Paenibacillus alkalitolerans TaxID=2799335 RepID=UPI0018F4284D|nr:MFS transporter [Paenibacillus alkalitolerans]
MKNRSFSLLLFNHTAGNLADILYITVIVLHIYELTGSVLASALFPFVRVIANFASSFVSPVLLGRVPLVRMMSVTRIGEVSAMAGLALFAVSGLDAVWLILSIVFATSFIQGWANPVTYSLIPRLVDEAGLSRANGMLGTAREITSVVGWLLGGIGAVWLGVPNMLAVSAILFASGAVAVQGLRVRAGGEPAEGKSEGGSPADKWTAIRLGWSELLRNRTARFITIMDAIEGFGYTVFIGSFTLTFVEIQLNRGPEYWGYINASYFVGMIAGGVLVTAAAKWLNQRLPLAMALGSLGYGAADVVPA